MRLRLLIAALFLIVPLTARGDTPAEPALRVEPSKVVSTFKIEMPHATFTLVSGDAARILYKGQFVGLCFRGNGYLEYLSQLPSERASLKYNLDKNSLAAATEGKDGLHLGIGFQRAVIWFAGRDIPLSGADGAPLQETFDSLQPKFLKDGLSCGQTASLSRLANGGTLPYVQADLDGEKAAFVYEFDPYHARFESLSLLSQEGMNEPALRGASHPVTLSRQPIGWDLHQPVPGDYMLRAVDVDLTQTAPLQGVLKVKESIQPTFAPLKSIRLNFSGTHFAFNGTGLDVHHAKVAKVTDASGHLLTFVQDAEEVTVELPAPAAPGSEVQLSFEIEGDFLVPPNNGNYWQLGTSAWYPQPDLNGQMHTWHAVVRVKKPWLAFSGGDTVRRWEDGDFNAVETRSEHPIAFGVILAGNYAIQRETRNGLTVEVATYGSKAQFSKALIDMAFLTVDYYQHLLGPYPYKEFHILEKNEWGYGQAPASIMFITKEAFNQTIGFENRLMAEDVRHRFVHEIAHQWWGTVVKMPSSEEQWLTESFAEICASLVLQDWPQHRADGEYLKLLAKWKTEATYASSKASIPAGNYPYDPNNSYENFRVRTGLIYDKGAWLLYCIRKEIGDDKFRIFLRSYQTNFKWKFGSTRDVAGLLSFITKKDWNPWFEKYYWGTGMPEAKE